MVAHLLAADAISAQVKIVKRESEFAAARGVTLVVGERIPGLKRWRLAKVERRLHGDDVPEPANGAVDDRPFVTSGVGEPAYTEGEGPK